VETVFTIAWNTHWAQSACLSLDIIGAFRIIRKPLEYLFFPKGAHNRAAQTSIGFTSGSRSGKTQVPVKAHGQQSRADVCDQCQW